MFKPRLSFWHMLLPALGLHGLLLAYPIDSEHDLETDLKLGKPVRVVKLPPISSPQVTLPISAKPVQSSKTQSALPLQRSRRVIQAVAPPTLQAKAAIATPQPSPLVPSPSPPPSLALSTPPSPSPNEFQLDGATASCNGAKNCYAIEETNGRLVSNQLEERLQRQGYALQNLDLEHEHGMTAYQLSKSGSPKDYLYVLWSSEGTTYLRSPVILSYEDLKLMARK